MSQGIHVTSRTWKNQKKERKDLFFFFKASRKEHDLLHFDLRSVLDF